MRRATRCENEYQGRITRVWRIFILSYKHEMTRVFITVNVTFLSPLNVVCHRNRKDISRKTRVIEEKKLTTFPLEYHIYDMVKARSLTYKFTSSSSPLFQFLTWLCVVLMLLNNFSARWRCCVFRKIVSSLGGFSNMWKHHSHVWLRGNLINSVKGLLCVLFFCEKMNMCERELAKSMKYSPCKLRSSEIFFHFRACPLCHSLVDSGFGIQFKVMRERALTGDEKKSSVIIPEKNGRNQCTHALASWVNTFTAIQPFFFNQNRGISNQRSSTSLNFVCCF